jgi:hypothetical protein
MPVVAHHRKARTDRCPDTFQASLMARPGVVLEGNRMSAIARFDSVADAKPLKACTGCSYPDLTAPVPSGVPDR